MNIKFSMNSIYVYEVDSGCLLTANDFVVNRSEFVSTSPEL